MEQFIEHKARTAEFGGNVMHEYDRLTLQSVNEDIRNSSKILSDGYISHVSDTALSEFWSIPLDRVHWATDVLEKRHAINSSWGFNWIDGDCVSFADAMASAQ